MIRTYSYSTEKGFEADRKPVRDPGPGAVLWTDIEIPDSSEVEVLGSVFGFHPLAVEDCIKMQQRAKLDDYQDYFFIVTQSVAEGRSDNRLMEKELDIFVGHNFIVTFHWEEVGPVSSVRQRIEKNPEILARGTDYLLYLILDAVIDDYFPFLDHLDDRYSRFEEKILENRGKIELNELLKLKRTLLEMRKILSPHREMVNALIRYEGLFTKEENRIFFLDVYDHLMRIFDFLDTYRELISGSLEIYLTVVSNRMNEIMKTLTIIATIMLPLTFISSIYGMNFRYMPELEWRYGYLWSIGLMLATAGGMVYYFRNKKWF